MIGMRSNIVEEENADMNVGKASSMKSPTFDLARRHLYTALPLFTEVC